MENRLVPFIKWAGGKTQLLDKLMDKMPRKYNRYYEPFIGGGALFLANKPSDAVINDINEQLINVYQQLKIDARKVICLINQFDETQCDKEYYLKLREKYNLKITNHKLDAECASLLIWLNKHCFNGLYRVNSKGLFNVPYNNSNKTAINETNLIDISYYLNSQNITITCSDFYNACATVSAGDFVYFDSPYIPINETAYFTDYTKTGFSLKDHERLAKLYKELDKKGALVMLSNHDVPLIYDLYKDFKIESINVKRNINSNALKRTGVEVIITNYE